MIYGTTNYAERERAAWQAGNYELAEALALADDAERNAAEHADAIFAAEQEKEQAMAEHRNERRELLRALDALGREIDSAKRMGNREAIEAALQAVYAILS